ncbi:hypothetical protein ACFCX0_36265 [Streptomyces sp. NPDC056352]|uniref:hypothetical protein n=1 Tax=Streptomyces sp. NPDC056352 TaxID=3345791 RepID=UPI0035E2F325
MRAKPERRIESNRRAVERATPSRSAVSETVSSPSNGNIAAIRSAWSTLGTV